MEKPRISTLLLMLPQKDNSEFEVVVVDQNTLDNSPELEFRQTSGGTMSANIISDKNVYQNYFLVLKSCSTNRN